MNESAESKLWQGRASGDVRDITVELGESITLDVELYREDLFGSAAHARMLQRIGILNSRELEEILEGLRRIGKEIEEGSLPLRAELEDIHTHVENRLVELIGEPARKLHTARSRNDQIAVDTHLFVRRASGELAAALLELCGILLERARGGVEIIIPGYTHLQTAQAVRLSHHLLAHFWFFVKDIERLQQAQRTADQLPLGSGALAGVNYPTDREFLRDELQFGTIHPNSLAAVAGREHILDFLYACSVFAVHASRLAEELTLWNSVEFSFITLPDALTTGSSIMPQKKNPDLAELSRGKTGRLIANLSNLLINLKGLPFAYNRDLQEDRHPMLDSRRQSLLVVRALGEMMRAVEFHPDRMERSLTAGFVVATDLADALVQKRGISFREAHHLAGRLVARALEGGWTLADIPREERRIISEYFVDEEFYSEAIDLHRSADKKISRGGTALSRQKEQLEEAAERLAELRAHPWPDCEFSL